MKKEFFLMLGFLSGGILILFLAFEFQKKTNDSFIKTKGKQVFLQKKLKGLKDDWAFMQYHQKEFSFFVKKGWITPKNRLIAGDDLGKLKGFLNRMGYTFEPEKTINMGERYRFKVTKIILEMDALLDNDIYIFLHELFEKFTGILRPIELVLSRGEEVNENNLLALKENMKLPFVQGKMVLEWVSMGVEGHEE